MRDLTKEHHRTPALWRQPPWRHLAFAALAGVAIQAAPAQPGQVLPTAAVDAVRIVALPDGRHFAAAGDLAYVRGMPPGARVGSDWRVYSATGAAPGMGFETPAPQRVTALDTALDTAPGTELGTVRLLAGPIAPDGVAIVAVMRSVRELTPGSVLVPLPGAALPCEAGACWHPGASAVPGPR